MALLNPHLPAIGQAILRTSAPLSERPLGAFLGRGHCRVALPGLMLGRGRRGDQRGVHQGAFAQLQAARGQVGVAGGEQALAQVVGFEPAAELQERGGGGPALGAQVNPGAAAQGLAVVEGVCEGFVCQALPLLEAIDPPPPLPPKGRAAARPLGLIRRDDGQQLGPREDCRHARGKLLAPGALLLPRKLGLGITGLLVHARLFG